MKYVSDDGKVFNTEQECCEYERQIIKDRARREQLEQERHNRLNIINKKCEELQKLLSEYEKDYGVRQKPYIASFYELLNMLCE